MNKNVSISLYIISIVFFLISFCAILPNMIDEQPHFYWLISIPLGITSLFFALKKRNVVLLIIAGATILIMPIMIFLISIFTAITQI